MKELFNDYVQSLETYIMVQIKQKTLELTDMLCAKGREPIYLSIGAPVKTPPAIVIETLKDCLYEPGISTYSTNKGEKYFLEAVKTRMKQRFGVDLDTKTEICSLIGSKEGLANLIRELINPTTDVKNKDIILIPDPGYASYKEMLKVSGGLAYSVPLTPENNYMPDLDETWENLIKEGYNPQKVKALIINYPNNPLGAVATREYIASAVAFCKKHNILLISDAAYCDIYFEGAQAPVSALEIEGAKDITLEFYSFSKSYSMTGWRVGWVCGGKEPLSMFTKLKSTIDTGLFKALQKASAAVLNSKEGDEFCKEMNKEFQKNQQILLNGFKELGWDIDNMNIPKATFYLWLPIPPRYNRSKDFTDELLEKSGIVVVPGDAFGKYGEGFFRISIVCAQEKLHEVISRMKQDGFVYKK